MAGTDTIPMLKAGDVITADFLNRLAECVVQKITVIGGTVQRSGTSLTIDVTKKGSPCPFIAKIMTAGPNSESNFSNARYWVKEQVVSFASDGTVTIADATNPRWVTATNVQELGIGASDAGTHGIQFASGETPSRASSLTAPDRYVIVWPMNGGYYFDSPPFVYLEDSYYYDVYGLDGDGCPDASKWWKGVLPFCVTDYDSAPA